MIRLIKLKYEKFRPHLTLPKKIITQDLKQLNFTQISRIGPAAEEYP